MKKKLLAMSFSFVLATPSMASASLIPDSIIKRYLPSSNRVKKAAQFNKDEYVDFSGDWLGTCDNAPDENIEMHIKLAPDFSSIDIDHVVYPIDAISTQGSHRYEQQENSTIHLRWSNDGQELLLTSLSYLSENNLAQGGLTSLVGNAQFFINNEQLISNFEFTSFKDGVLGSTAKIHCSYKKLKAALR